MKISFICLGNICRSPMAHFMFEHYAKEKGFEVQVESAGFLKLNREASEYTKKVLENENIIYSNRVSKFCDKDIIVSSNYIITMTESQKYKLIEMYGHDEKIICISKFNDNKEVFDPYGMSIEAYETVFDMLKNALPKIFEYIKN